MSKGSNKSMNMSKGSNKSMNRCIWVEIRV